jgi:hypothetical protein
MKKENRIELTIYKEKIVLKKKETKIIDVDDDMKNVAWDIAKWGKILGRARQEKIEAEAFYKNWRENEINILLKRDKKMSEWKATANVKSRKMYYKLKTAIAQAESNVQTVEAIYEAFKTKAFLLPSKGARDRDVMNKIGMKTKKK